MSLKLHYITNDARIANIAQSAGVDRIFVDLELRGKRERQKNRDTLISYHTIKDVAHIRPTVTSAELLVRVNSVYGDTQKEVDQAVNAGADLIMLPMFRTRDEAKFFLDCVKKRVKTVLLVETRDAVENIDDILTLDEVDEYFIGLNDLHLSYKLMFMFELLSNGVVENLCAKIKAAGKPYGIGGIARVGQGQLLSNYILGEHYRLQSSSVILSRSFCNATMTHGYDTIQKIFQSEVRKIRQYEEFLTQQSETFFSGNHKLLCENIIEVKDILSSNPVTQ